MEKRSDRPNESAFRIIRLKTKTWRENMVKEAAVAGTALRLGNQSEQL
jgi:hypothetical protein